LTNFFLQVLNCSTVNCMLNIVETAMTVLCTTFYIFARSCSV